VILKSFRYLLIPFSFIYGAVIWIRNWLYDKNFFKSSSFNFPLICVGNLAVGGTGKTPMVEYLLRLLKKEYKVATLSRGYKRKTVGFGIAAENTTALEIGDEPMQFFKKFPDVTVAVGEERLVAIPQLLQDRPETELIILDDAFQHRSVQAGLNILLTEYKDLYTRDLPLPAGDLRDVRMSAKRAQIIIVTKCKQHLSEQERQAIIKELDPKPYQKIYFTEIRYSKPYHLFRKQELDVAADTDILLVCGIANPGALKDFLAAHFRSYDMLRFSDHHIFTTDDLREIKKQFEKIKSSSKIILTTEKDGVRMKKFESELADFPLYVIPIQHHFLFNEAAAFNRQVIDFIKSFPAGLRQDMVQSAE
jgi:tetraacyldisaccharide 4'-kinase